MTPDVDDAILAYLQVRDAGGTPDPAEWLAELPKVEEHFAKLGDHLPEAMRTQLADLRTRLAAAT